MAVSKSAFAALDYYAKAFVEKYGRKARMNRHRDKWAMNDVVDDLGLDEAQALIDYYFKVERPTHDLSWFFNNYDKLAEAKERRDADRARRMVLLKQTRERANK